MYGRIRGPELPVYGAKTLAVRDGILDLHGKKLNTIPLRKAYCPLFYRHVQGVKHHVY